MALARHCHRLSDRFGGSEHVLQSTEGVSVEGLMEEGVWRKPETASHQDTHLMEVFAGEGVEYRRERTAMSKEADCNKSLHATLVGSVFGKKQTAAPTAGPNVAWSVLHDTPSAVT